MDLLEEFRQWCHKNQQNSTATHYFLKWFHQNEQKKMAYIQGHPDFWEKFLEKGYLKELDFELFFNYLKSQPGVFENVVLPVKSLAPMKLQNVEKSLGKSQSFGKYEVLSKIGQGGMGVVYKVQHRDLKNIYALKVISTNETRSDPLLPRFHQEAKITAKLKHPGIVQVFDSGVEHDQHYFVMEYVEGKTLGELIQEGLSIRQGVLILKKALEALHYAHLQGVIHRDIKPENIFVTKTYEPKIGDFGLAKERGNLQESKETQEGTLLGTPYYMAPEQIQGKMKLTPKTDIYAMGVCLYQTLTSSCPFEDPSIHALLYKITHEEPISPSKKNPQIHRDLEAITLKALEKLKHKRYATAKAFSEDLESFLSGYPIRAQSLSPLQQISKKIRRNPFPWILVLILIVFVLGVAEYLYFKKKQEQETRFQEALEKEKKESALARKIESQQGKLKQEHLKNFDFWISYLKSEQIIEGDPLEAIFEIIKMKEPEILEKLLRYLDEGTLYFLRHPQPTQREELFYLTLLEALGRLGNQKAGPFLANAIEQIEAQLISSAELERNTYLLNYLRFLVQALANSQAVEFLSVFDRLRKSLGENFWKQIKDFHTKLLEKPL
ncbi:MAG: serine/threonine-protein kinase [Planctomycetota bacterium]